jgi:hypothetical protein
MSSTGAQDHAGIGAIDPLEGAVRGRAVRQRDVEHLAKADVFDRTGDVMDDHVLGSVQPGIRAGLAHVDRAEVESFCRGAKSFKVAVIDVSEAGDLSGIL